MDVESLVQYVPSFVPAAFRVAAMCLSTPMFGSRNIPRRVRTMFALVLTLGLMPVLPPVAAFPASMWTLAIGIGGEILFGVVLGMATSFVFVSVQWAGEIMGQQMGLSLGETFDPQAGVRGSAVGDIYFLMTLVIFLVIRGHHALIKGVAASFTVLPPLSFGMTPDVLDMIVNLLGATTTLALQLAAPMLVTLLVVELVLGFIGKSVPQINVMTSGLSLRTMVGMVVLIVGIGMSSEVIRDATMDLLRQAIPPWQAAPAQ